MFDISGDEHSDSVMVKAPEGDHIQSMYKSKGNVQSTYSS